MTITKSSIPNVSVSDLNQIVRLISGLAGGPLGFRVAVERLFEGINDIFEGGSVETVASNNTGGTLAAGDLVYIASYDSVNDRDEVALADADEIGKMATHVIVAGGATGSTVTIAAGAVVTGVDTSVLVEDDVLYLTVTGTTGNTWSTTAPPAPAQQQRVGVVQLAAAAGVIRFFPGQTSLQRIAAIMVTLADAGGAITATEVEGALQEIFLLARGNTYYGDAAGKLARADIKALGAVLAGDGADATVVNLLTSALGGTAFNARAYSGAVLQEPPDNATLTAALGSLMLLHRHGLTNLVMDETSPPTATAGRGLVVTGGVVAEQAVPDLTVQVSAAQAFNHLGKYANPGDEAALGGFTIPAGAGDGRQDIVVIDAVGAIARRVGTEGAVPSDPALSAGDIPLARVTLTEGVDTEIQAGNITDLRQTAQSIDSAKLLDIPDAGSLYVAGGLAAMLQELRTTGVFKSTVDSTVDTGELTLAQAVTTPRGEAAGADDVDTISGLADAGWAYLVTGAEAITYRDFAVGGGNISTVRDASLVTATGDVVLAIRSGAVVYVVPLMVQAGVPTSSATTGVTVAEDGRLARVEEYANIPAAGVNIVAQLAGDVDEQTWANITQPTVPRTARVVFSALWDGGDVEVTGSTVNGVEEPDTITAAAGSTVEGTKAYVRITRVRNLGTWGAGTADVQTGPSLGFATGGYTIPNLQVYEDSAGGKITDGTLNGNIWTPGALAFDGVRDWTFVYRVANAYTVTDAGHEHQS